MQIKLKSVFYVLILIYLAISCSDKPDLEGLWQNAGDYDSLDNKVDMGGAYFLFDEDSVVVMHLSIDNREKDTLAYELTDSKLIIGESVYDYYYDDSLRLYHTYDLYPGFSSVFKKLRNDKKAKSFEKLNLDGFYALIREDGDTLFHFEFFNDNFLQHDKDWWRSDYPYGRWDITEMNGFHFFNSYGILATLRIDSCFENKITLIGDYDAEYKFSLERYEPAPIREKFIGNWTITDAYTLTDSGANDIGSAEIKSIIFDKDSLRINGEKSKLKWLLSFDERFILFPDIGYYDEGARWHLNELSDYKMTIILYSDYEMKAVLTFVKAPYESDNPFAGHKQM